MSTLDLTPFFQSPRLPDIASALNEHLRAETEARSRFYDQMSDSEKVEFIAGEVILHSSARNQHLLVKFNLTTLLGTYVRQHALGEVRDEKCLCVFPRNDYEPDIVFFGSEKAATFLPGTMKFPVPDFVVEVLSESTASRDRGVKFEDYEAHGVQEYWLIDPESETVEQYRLDNGQFELELKSASGDIISHIITGFQIPIRAIFNPAENLSALKRLLQ